MVWDSPVLVVECHSSWPHCYCMQVKPCVPVDDTTNVECLPVYTTDSVMLSSCMHSQLVSVYAVPHWSAVHDCTSQCRGESWEW